MTDSRPGKRARLEELDPLDVRSKRAAFLNSLSAPVSPPRKKETCAKFFEAEVPAHSRKLEDASNNTNSSVKAEVSHSRGSSLPASSGKKARFVRSPIQLLKARGLPDAANVDTVDLHDVIGDPLIKEAWIFNFCFDVNWTMHHFDEDVRRLVKVKIVHGSWKQEDGNRLGIEADVKNWPNVEAVTAYLPDPFGTHHSKMFILFRHDDTAQIIIHTANMLEQDWHHMTQAVWRSPMLSISSASDVVTGSQGPIGSGQRFKYDFLSYLKAYGNKLKTLVSQISQYDFEPIRAALVASVPKKFKASQDAPLIRGHTSLRQVIQALRQQQQQRAHLSSAVQPHLVCQISSIATLPVGWLNETIVAANQLDTPDKQKDPLSFSIVYPTPKDMSQSLSGYACGGSIHTKAQTATHLKQIEKLRPHLNRWTQNSTRSGRAHRDLVPPHIKTYISFQSRPTGEVARPDIEWALVTSANLSTQAWGTIPKLARGEKDKSLAEIHIQSYEIGVLVWPELFIDETEVRDSIGADLGGSKDTLPSQTISNSARNDGRVRRARMVPVFGKDDPSLSSTSCDSSEVVVGLRMPYDLPLTPYTNGELPWSPSSIYREPDRLNRTWPPDQSWLE